MNPITNLHQGQNKVIVSMGYDNTTTNITLASGHGAMLSDVSTPYNLTWWNSTDYLSPTDDPYVEVVKCIAKFGDTLVIMRSQQQTLASPKNIPGKLYNMALLPDTLHDSNLDTNLNTLSYYNIPQTHGISAHTGIIGDHSTNLSNVGTNTHAQIDTAITASIGHIAASGTSVHSLGTMSTQSAGNVTITGGSITGITDLTVSGNVGIGTMSPNSKLHVQNPVGVANIEIEGGLYPIQDDATVNFVRSGVYNWRIGLDSSDGNKFKILGGTFETPSFLGVTIQPGGNVGIGTASPATTLELGLNTSGGLALGQGKLYLSQGGDTNHYIQLTSSGITYYDNTAHLFQGGNVGIGTTNPQDKLDIADGTLRVQRYGGINLISDATVGNIRGLRIQPDAGISASLVRIQGWNFTSSTETAINTVFTGGGNVGIGTTGPNQKLDVSGVDVGIAIGNLWNGITAYNSYIGKPASSGGWIDGSAYIKFNDYLSEGVRKGTNIDFYSHNFGVSTSVVMSIVGDGNVGIGTLSPITRLEILGSGTGLPPTSGTTVSAGEVIRIRPGDNAVLDIGGNSASGAWLQSTDQTALQVGYPLLLNPNGGNVGIGTTSPSYKLDVLGSTSLARFNGEPPQIIVQYPDDPYPVEIRKHGHTFCIGYPEGWTGALLSLERPYWTGAKFVVDNNGNVISYGTGISSFAGNVGIGTTGPTSKLHLYSPVTGQYLNMGSAGGGAGVVQDAIRMGYGGIGGMDRYTELGTYYDGSSGMGYKLSVWKSDTPGDLLQEAMVIQPNGNVGIGTTNPGLKLQVDGITGLPATTGSTQTGVFRVGVPTYGSVIDMGTEGASGRSWIQVTNESNLADTFALLLNPNGGNVGIGITNPTAKLHIGGTSGVDGIKFPDGTLQTTAAVGQPITTYYASNAIRVAHDAENLTSSGTYVVNKTITLKQRFMGSMTIVYNHRTVNSAGTNMSKVLVNGSLVGVEHTQSDNTNNVYSVTVSNVDYAVNTTIQVWAKSTGSYPWTYISNFRLLYADAVNS